jgi:YggT family protein
MQSLALSIWSQSATADAPGGETGESRPDPPHRPVGHRLPGRAGRGDANDPPRLSRQTGCGPGRGTLHQAARARLFRSCGTCRTDAAVPGRARWIEVGVPMRAVLDVILLVLHLYSYIIIATAIISWLLAFDVINFRNDLVRSVWNFLNGVTEPLLRPIRNILPNLGGIDVSPIILLLLLFLVEDIIQRYIYPYVF